MVTVPLADNVTGLMWQQGADTDGDGDIDVDDKLTYDEAMAGVDSFGLAGYDDWRLPTIKELYSLIDFNGLDPSGYGGSDTSSLVPFIDTDYFDFGYGDTNAGERIIDAQFATSTLYVSTTMGGAETMFGVNFADGRIKGYPTGPMPGQSGGKLYYVLYVRGNSDYGINDFADNDSGTITDNATGLMWSQDDSGSGLNWEEALAYVEAQNDANYLGYSDWRLPNVKELQSIVDYTRSPDTTDSAAINPLFNVTTITNEADQIDYPAYWSSTTHANMRSGGNASYVNFGRSMGYMNGRWMDVHGAGAQRSDPKSGDPGQLAHRPRSPGRRHPHLQLCASRARRQHHASDIGDAHQFTYNLPHCFCDYDHSAARTQSQPAVDSQDGSRDSPYLDRYGCCSHRSPLPRPPPPAATTSSRRWMKPPPT